jgi:uncharacterized protein YndB with AHSA1/START domain
MNTTTKITVQADINAEPKKVWEYYTKPEHITKWNFASDDWHCPSATNDLRVGGIYNARMEAKDKSFGFDFKLVYDKIVDQKTIAYTMEDGRKATVDFDGKGNTTHVTVTFDAESQNSEAMQQQGWQMILNNFKKYVESK